MASSSVEEVIVGDDELGILDNLEIDGVVLKDLLEDLEKEMAGEDTEQKHLDTVDCFLDPNKSSLSSSSSCPIHDEFDWLGMMEIDPPAIHSDDLVWYVDETVGMVDFGCHGECLEFYNGVLWEGESYGSLWHDM